MSLSPRSRDRIVWLATVFVSALIIWVGHAQVMEGLHIFPDTGNVVTEGRVYRWTMNMWRSIRWTM